AQVRGRWRLAEARQDVRRTGSAADGSVVGGLLARLLSDGTGIADPFVVADHLGDDEAHERLREGGVQSGVIREGAQARDLLSLAVRVCGWQSVLGLQHAHPLGVSEALGEQVHEGRVDVVDAAPLLGEEDAGTLDRLLAGCGRGIRCAHALCSWRPVPSARSASLPVSMSGARPSVTTPAVMTTLTTSSREGTSNITGCSASSRIARRPRAPVSRSVARSALAPSALRAKSSSTPSSANIFCYCLTSALRGSVRIVMSASRSRSETLVMTGRRPMTSGIRPNFSRSSGRSLP